MSADLQGSTPPPTTMLARRYAELLPAPLERTFFVGSGSEATEAAVKMVRMYHALHDEPARRTVLSLADGYHGTTLAAVSAIPAPSSQALRRSGIRVPGRRERDRARHQDLDELADIFATRRPDVIARAGDLVRRAVAGTTPSLTYEPSRPA